MHFFLSGGGNQNTLLLLFFFLFFFPSSSSSFIKGSYRCTFFVYNGIILLVSLIFSHYPECCLVTFIVSDMSKYLRSISDLSTILIVN